MIYKPSPSQQRAHDMRVREICYAGAAGPGKTTWLIGDPIIVQLPVEHERWRRGEIEKSVGWCIHFRREYPMLEQTVLKARDLYTSVDPSAPGWSEENYTFTFSCGYKVQFAHMSKEGDWRIYDSQEYTEVEFDELVMFTKEQYDRMKSRVRTTDPVLKHLLRVVSATNPEAGWVKDYFINPAPDGNTILRNKVRMDDGTYEVRDRVFLPALLRDNPDSQFRRDYEITLQELAPHIRFARLHGRWDVIEGAFFAEECIPSVHFVEPYAIPSGWTKFRVLDWGYKTYAVVKWYAVDTDGCLVCYRERNFHKKIDLDVAIAIREEEKKYGEWDSKRNVSKLVGSPADNQIWAETGQSGPTIAENMATVGVFWERASKGRHSGTTQLLHRLRDVPEEGKGRPGISWFKTCKKSCETLPLIKVDPNDPEVPDNDRGKNHWLDCDFYACMSRPVVPKYDVNPEGYKDDWPEDEVTKRRRSQMGAYGVVG